MDRIYTIGYSGFKIEKFLETLNFYSIKALIDVRSNPYSKYFLDYNKNILENTLRKNGNIYRNYDIEFGARQTDKKFYNSEGVLDFEKFSLSPQFQSGVKKILKGLEQNYSFVLMCSEKEPINCHRAILVSRAFNELGIKVIHIMPDNKNFTQKDLELQMLNKYFPDRMQGNLFEGFKSDEELIKEAYKLCNAEIGYRMDGEKDKNELVYDRLHTKVS